MVSERWDGLGWTWICRFRGSSCTLLGCPIRPSGEENVLARVQEQNVSIGSDKIGQFPIALICGGSDKNGEEPIKHTINIIVHTHLPIRLGPAEISKTQSAMLDCTVRCAEKQRFLHVTIAGKLGSRS